MYWNQKDQAVLELGGHPEKLFLLWMVAVELAYQQDPEVFGTVEDLAAHKARIAELEAKRKELYARFPNSWAHGDLHIGRITSDGAALITFAKATGEVPVDRPETAGERLVEYLLRKEAECGASDEGEGGLQRGRGGLKGPYEGAALAVLPALYGHEPAAEEALAVWR